MTVTARVQAPAKLNLSLAIVGRRQDGLHELAGTFVLLELSDTLLTLPGCAGLRVEGTAAGGVPIDRGRNLGWRGLVAGLGHEPDEVCLMIEKRIPAAAGLGGGSSDAAAAWRLGRRMAGIAEEQPAPGELAELVAIGADVPFLAAGVAAAWVTGVGERVRPLPAIARHVVLVHPPFGLETAAVFAELRRVEWSGPPARPVSPEPGPNDLLAPARRLRPEIDELFALVSAAGGTPQLTGSGPTVFSISDDPDRAASIVERLRRGGLRVTLTRTATRAATIESLDETEEDE